MPFPDRPPKPSRPPCQGPIHSSLEQRRGVVDTKVAPRPCGFHAVSRRRKAHHSGNVGRVREARAHVTSDPRLGPRATRWLAAGPRTHRLRGRAIRATRRMITARARSPRFASLATPRRRDGRHRARALRRGSRRGGFRVGNRTGPNWRPGTGGGGGGRPRQYSSHLLMGRSRGASPGMPGSLTFRSYVAPTDRASAPMGEGAPRLVLRVHNAAGITASCGNGAGFGRGLLDVGGGRVGGNRPSWPRPG